MADDTFWPVAPTIRQLVEKIRLYSRYKWIKTVASNFQELEPFLYKLEGLAAICERQNQRSETVAAWLRALRSTAYLAEDGLEKLEYNHKLGIVDCHSLARETSLVFRLLGYQVSSEDPSDCYILPSSIELLFNRENSRRSVKHWREVPDTIKVLEYGYCNLPIHLRRCFAYLSIFPKDWKFDRDKLVELWVAQGFVEPQKDRKIMPEDLGKCYFDNLASRSFLEIVEDGHGISYIMSNLMHDLAEYVSGDECHRIDGVIQNIPQSIRHLGVVINRENELGDILSQLETLSNLEGLRSLIFFPRYPNLRAPLGDQLNGLMEKLKKIRVLDFSDLHLQIQPPTLGNLIHLRVLVAPNAEVSFDTSLSNLIKFGKLTSLEVLLEFDASSKDVHLFKDLKKLKRLRGLCLLLMNLESISSVHTVALELQEVQTDVLELKFGGNGTMCYDMEIVECLEPHLRLRQLTVEGFSSYYSRWLEADWLSNLLSLTLINCGKWQDLPSLGHLPCLRKLEIKCMPALRRVGSRFYGYTRNDVRMGGFQSLEELIFEEMPELVEWWVVQEEDHHLFACLRKVVIGRCPKLEFLRFGKYKVSIREMLVQPGGLTINLMDWFPGIWQRICLLLQFLSPRQPKLLIFQPLPRLERFATQRRSIEQLCGLPIPRVLDIPIKFHIRLQEIQIRNQVMVVSTSLPKNSVLQFFKYVGIGSFCELSSSEGSLNSCKTDAMPVKVISEIIAPACLFSVGSKTLRITNHQEEVMTEQEIAQIVSHNPESIFLSNCIRWKVLPPLGHLRSLRRLEVRGMPSVRQIGLDFYGGKYSDELEGFPALEELVFEDMPALTEWSAPMEWFGMEEQDSYRLFPHLMRIKIRKCPKLLQFPFFEHPFSLMQHLTEVEFLFTEWSPAILLSQRVHIAFEGSFIPSKTMGLQEDHFRAFKSLVVNDCQADGLPVEGLVNLVSLRKLVVKDSPKLLASKIILTNENEDLCEALLPSSLETLLISRSGLRNQWLSMCLQGLLSLCSLDIFNCTHLTSLPSAQVLSCLTALRKVEIHGCEELISLGDLLFVSSIKELQCTGCPNLILMNLEDERNKGEESSNILSSSLESFVIRDCGLTDQWLSKFLKGCNLSNLEISCCTHLMSLPSSEVLQHITKLQRLVIHGCERLSSLGGLHSLPSLEVLTVTYCPQLDALPKEGLPLSLTLLAIGDTGFKTVSMVRCIGRLTSLSTLNIEGCTCLTSLTAVNLQSMTALDTLHLNDCEELQSLEGMDGLICLKELTISNCPNLALLGKKLPTSIEYIHLSGCQALASLDGLEALESLHHLDISWSPKLEILQAKGLPTSVEVLQLVGCRRLTSLRGLHTVVSLKKLEVKQCHKLLSLSDKGFPPSVRSIHLSGCHELRSLEDTEALPSLYHLELKWCPIVEAMQKKKKLPASMEVLQLWGCNVITTLKGIHALASLKDLEVKWCPKLESLPDNKLPTTLRRLQLWGCQELKSLGCLHNLTNLKQLEVKWCPKLQALPNKGLPASVEYLVLCECHEELMQQLQEENGHEWDKISHIPHICLSS